MTSAKVQNGSTKATQVRMHSLHQEGQLADAATEADTDARAEADVAAGRVVSHAKVVEWLRSWGKPDELPCPIPPPQ